MFNCTLYRARKRVNSTYTPTQGVATLIELKDECSLINPYVTFAVNAAIPYQEYNYCYIPHLKRYYHITEWQWQKGRYAALLKCDVLASYKADILASSQYVLRAASANDGRIIDTVYPVKAQSQTQTLTLGINTRQNMDGGYFMLGLISPDGSIYGSTTYYLLNGAAMVYLRSLLLSNVTWTNVTEITDELLQTLFNPFQYIVSCKWFPVSPPVADLTAVTTIKFGYWSFDLSSIQGAHSWQYIPKNLSTLTLTRYRLTGAQLPIHPQAATRGMYLNGNSYSEFYLQCTGYGMTKLPNDAFVSRLGLTIYETIDFVSGESILNVYMGANETETTTCICSIHSHMGFDMPYGSSDQNILSAANSALSGITSGIDSIVSKGFGGIGGAIQNVISGVVSAVTEAAPVVQKGGSSASFAALGEYTGIDSLQAVYHIIADEDNADFGRPLCQTRTLSTLSGYVLCANSHIAIDGTAAEAREIEAFLQSGCFLE